MLAIATHDNDFIRPHQTTIVSKTAILLNITILSENDNR